MAVIQGTFEEITKPLKQVKRDYLGLRILGITMEDALSFVGRHKATGQWWMQDDEFDTTEKYLVENKDRFIGEVYKYFQLKFAAMDYAVIDIAYTGLSQWEKLDKKDRGDVKWAYEQAKKLGTKEKEKDKGYEEKILEYRNRHEENK